jgi:hypothetical protein
MLWWRKSGIYFSLETKKNKNNEDHILTFLLFPDGPGLSFLFPPDRHASRVL